MATDDWHATVIAFQATLALWWNDVLTSVRCKMDAGLLGLFLEPGEDQETFIEDFIRQNYAGLRGMSNQENFLYAYLKTGRLVSDQAYKSFPQDLRDEWDQAIDEYRKMDKTKIDWDLMLENLVAQEKNYIRRVLREKQSVHPASSHVH